MGNDDDGRDHVETGRALPLSEHSVEQQSHELTATDSASAIVKDAPVRKVDEESSVVAGDDEAGAEAEAKELDLKIANGGNDDGTSTVEYSGKPPLDTSTNIRAQSNSIPIIDDETSRGQGNSSHSDMDTSVSVATSYSYEYSADDELKSLNLLSRKKNQRQHTIPEHDSMGMSGLNDPPADLREFPSSPFKDNQQWDDSFGIFPTSFDSNHEKTFFPQYRRPYGSLDSSEHSGPDAKISADMMVKESQEASEIDLSYGSQYSPPKSPRSISSTESKSYDYNDLSSSEQTPILSNHAPRGSPTRLSLDFGSKSPCSIDTIDEENDGMKEELKMALLKSPTRKAMIKVRSRQENLHKFMVRQKSISLMVEDIRGKKQPTSCRDVFFAIMYIFQLLVIVFIGLRFGPETFGLSQEEAEEKLSQIKERPGIHFSYVDVLTIILSSGLGAIIISAFAFIFMAIYAKKWIPVALRLATTLSIGLTLFGLVDSPKNLIPVFGLFVTGLTVAYAFVVWDEIPFVSANLYTALIACRSAYTIIGIAIVTQVFALIWIVIYFLTTIGLYNHFQEVGNLDMKWRIWAYVGLGLSFNWTIQAMMNIIEVCIAGYIHRWWRKPNINQSQKLDAIGESLIRAMVYSFGSVCFGSMFIGVVNFFRAVAEQIRPNREEAAIKSLVVLQEIIVSYIDRAAEVFNEYAMINIGMYGYNFLEAGKQANSLFEKRGWQHIVSNSLLSHLLLIISLIVAGLTGCVAVEVERIGHLPLVSPVAHPTTMSFCLGCFVGFVLSNILFNVITSSVKSVMICFAGSPAEFHENHPECSQIMREAWKESWPGIVDFVEGKPGNMRGKSPKLNVLRFKRESLESLYV